MNITNYEADKFTPNWLEDIFTKQTALIEKYKEIEEMPDLPVSIHTHIGQKWIKDFLWRTSEELAESFEAYFVESNKVHTIEELIDSLHFIVELIILIGKDWKWAREQLDTAEPLSIGMDKPGDYWTVMFYMGMVGNTLKNKPWKQTEMPTDEEKFYSNLGKAFKSLFNCLKSLGADEKVVFDYYTRKNQVNQFRIKSQY